MRVVARLYTAGGLGNSGLISEAFRVFCLVSSLYIVQNTVWVVSSSLRQPLEITSLGFIF